MAAQGMDAPDTPRAGGGRQVPPRRERSLDPCTTVDPPARTISRPLHPAPAAARLADRRRDWALMWPRGRPGLATLDPAAHSNRLRPRVPTTRHTHTHTRNTQKVCCCYERQPAYLSTLSRYHPTLGTEESGTVRYNFGHLPHTHARPGFGDLRRHHRIAREEDSTRETG